MQTQNANNGNHNGLTITVNTRDYDWNKEEISYEEVVELAYPGQPPTDVIGYTVDWEHHHQSGSLTPGHSVEIKNKMIFDVTKTNRS